MRSSSKAFRGLSAKARTASILSAENGGGKDRPDLTCRHIVVVATQRVHQESAFCRVGGLFQLLNHGDSF